MFTGGWLRLAPNFKDLKMLNKLLEALKALSTSDKYLLGAAAAILINPAVALIVSALILTFFAYKIGKQVL